MINVQINSFNYIKPDTPDESELTTINAVVDIPKIHLNIIADINAEITSVDDARKAITGLFKENN